jgi:25S rRNA (uracil2843-N3)-methyltransferase
MSQNRFLPNSEESDKRAQNDVTIYASPEQYLLDTLYISNVFNDPELLTKSRQIKDLFLKRDFLSIFTNTDLLPVYALEYSSSRGLCYRDVFLILNVLHEVLVRGGKIALLGGGNGAELLGISSLLHSLNSRIEFIVQDLSNYNILDELMTKIRSNYQLNDKLTLNIDTGNLEDKTYLNSLSWISDADIITACFLLNELLTNSKKSFVQLVQYLVTAMKKGSLLLVIDSAGSFSEVNVAGNKDYMIFNLLDQIKHFRILETYDSVWYRYPDGLTYPLKLKNSRFFLRLYQKL